MDSKIRLSDSGVLSIDMEYDIISVKLPDDIINRFIMNREKRLEIQRKKNEEITKEEHIDCPHSRVLANKIF